jgi:hypothetical protein
LQDDLISGRVIYNSSCQVRAWGCPGPYGVTTIPDDAKKDVKAIAAGGQFAMALKRDGHVVTWGDPMMAQNMPNAVKKGGVRAIAAGFGHALAVTSDNNVVQWSTPSIVNWGALPPTPPPSVSASGKAFAVAAFGKGSLALAVV